MGLLCPDRKSKIEKSKIRLDFNATFSYWNKHVYSVPMVYKPYFKPRDFTNGSVTEYARIAA